MAIIKNPNIVIPQDYQVVWNQLIAFGNFSLTVDSAYWRNLSVSGGIASPTTSEGITHQWSGVWPEGHKFYLATTSWVDSGQYVVGLLDTNGTWVVWQSLTNNSEQRHVRISSQFTGSRTYFSLFLGRSYSIAAPSFRWVHLIDLTQMFGEGNEPTTTTEFESWLQENNIDPDSYIPFDYGTIKSMTKPSWIV